MAQTPQTSGLTPDDVLALVQERDIRFIRLWFTDRKSTRLNSSH